MSFSNADHDAVVLKCSCAAGGCGAGGGLLVVKFDMPVKLVDAKLFAPDATSERLKSMNRDVTISMDEALQRAVKDVDNVTGKAVEKAFAEQALSNGAQTYDIPIPYQEHNLCALKDLIIKLNVSLCHDLKNLHQS